MTSTISLQQFQKNFGLKLSDQQQRAVSEGNRVVLLLAVPGSGKTTTLIARLGYLIYVRGVKPENLLAITYTVSAARRMRLVYSDTFGEETGCQITFQTINALCWEIVSAYYKKRNRVINVCDEKKQKRYIRELLKHYTREAFSLEADVIAVQTLISYIKNQMLTDEAIQSEKWEIDHLAEIYTAYTRMLVENKEADFDDQMRFALTILEKNPAILESYQKRFTYISVDESQDTSLLQHRILQILCGSSGNLFLVGDEDQSIYGYRGAYPAILIHLNEYYAGSQTLKLETNYRSCAEIVQASKQFIDRNSERIAKDIKAFRGPGGKLVVVDVKARKEQLMELLKLCKGKKGSTAVLYRNNDSAIPLVDLFERNHIPYRLNKVKDTFFNGRTVTEVRSFLTYAHDVNNSDLFMKCYSKFGLYFRKDRAEAAVKWFRRNNRSLLDEFVEQNHYLKGYKKYQIDQAVENAEEFRRVFSGLLKKKPTDALKQLLNLGYQAYLEDKEIGTGQFEILEMLADASETIDSFLKRLDQVKDLLMKETDKDNAVIFSTIHSAKGMEFDRVILYDVMNGILPAVNAAENPKQYQEERRLFYVGMTRAKNELYLLSVKQKKHSFVEEMRPMKPTAQQTHQSPKKKRKIRTLNKLLSYYRKGQYFWIQDVCTKQVYQILVTQKNADIAKIAAWHVAEETGEMILCTDEVVNLHMEKRWRLYDAGTLRPETGKSGGN